jgi:hypothetical protein
MLSHACSGMECMCGDDTSTWLMKTTFLGHIIEELGLGDDSLGEDLFCMVFWLLMGYHTNLHQQTCLIIIGHLALSLLDASPFRLCFSSLRGVSLKGVCCHLSDESTQSPRQSAHKGLPLELSVNNQE